MTDADAASEDDEDSKALLYILCDMTRELLPLTDEQKAKLDKAQASIYSEEGPKAPAP